MIISESHAGWHMLAPCCMLDTCLQLDEASHTCLSLEVQCCEFKPRYKSFQIDGWSTCGAMKMEVPQHHSCVPCDCSAERLRRISCYVYAASLKLLTAFAAPGPARSQHCAAPIFAKHRAQSCHLLQPQVQGGHPHHQMQHAGDHGAID